MQHFLREHKMKKMKKDKNVQKKDIFMVTNIIRDVKKHLTIYDNKI